MLVTWADNGPDLSQYMVGLQVLSAEAGKTLEDEL